MVTQTIECPACDGDGSLSNQWAKAECIRTNGRSERMPDHHRLERNIPSWYMCYWTSEGRSIPHKTIGGDCRVCKGKGEIQAEINDKGEVVKCYFNVRGVEHAS